MSTLWSKGENSTKDYVLNFTTGNDRILDLRLAKHDVKGSLAHIQMLQEINLLTKDELEILTGELKNILSEIEDGKFILEEGIEDIHSQVEFILTQRLGEVGKKIHSGRSRNDQVLTDIKLFLKEEIEIFINEIDELFSTLQELSEKHKDKLLPGYTHMQIAMPSSFGLWFGAYAETLVDDVYMLKGAYNVVNQNPLGSAAGYGSSFPLDREKTTELMGFKTLNYNSVAAQLSRGKSEKALASALSGLALTLNKFAADCCMYMCPNYGFIKFPDSLTTGSSIMPHKKNPDVWELIRGNCNRIQSVPNEISLMTTNLPHGYHRDYQLLKDILFPSLEMMHKCIEMTTYMLKNIEVKENILDDEKYEYLFTVEKVNDLVLQGIPFREAYKIVGKEVNEGKFSYKNKINHTHKGSIGNLCTEEIRLKMKAAQE